MKKYHHLMIDIEAMGSGSNAIICSLSAIPFERYTGETGEVFTRNIDITSCLELGLKMGEGWITWFITQSKDTQEALCGRPFHLAKVLTRLNAFCELHMETDFKIWGNGPSGHMARLGDAYQACHLEIPWKGFNERCVRTEINGQENRLHTELPFEGIWHSTEAHARHQIKQIEWVHTRNKVIGNVGHY